MFRVQILISNNNDMHFKWKNNSKLRFMGVQTEELRENALTILRLT